MEDEGGRSAAEEERWRAQGQRPTVRRTDVVHMQESRPAEITSQNGERLWAWRRGGGGGIGFCSGSLTVPMSSMKALCLVDQR